MTLSILTGHAIEDSQCGYRAYATRLLRAVTLTCDRFDLETEVIIKACAAGFEIHSIPIQTLYFSGPSHIAHLADTLRWLSAVARIWLTTRRTPRHAPS